MQPGGKRGRQLFSRELALGTGFLRQAGPQVQSNRYTGPHQLEKITARQIETINVSRDVVLAILGFVKGWLAHCVTPFREAACWMAATIRGYVPQRQMLPSMRRAISSSRGLGSASRRATADMIIPDVQ